MSRGRRPKRTTAANVSKSEAAANVITIGLSRDKPKFYTFRRRGGPKSITGGNVAKSEAAANVKRIKSGSGAISLC